MATRSVQARIRQRIRQRIKDTLHKRGNPRLAAYVRQGAIVQWLMARLPRDDWTRYQIDHVVPLRAFDLNEPGHVRAAFAPENHQWLPATVNNAKSAVVNTDAMLALISKYAR